jgi:ureidoacrylate peracid hydrolase
MKKALVVIDVQREYNTPGRLFCLKGIEKSLAKIQEVLKGARSAGIPIIHVRHLQDGNIFSRQDSHSEFIEGFEPLPGETYVEKSDYSSFSSPAFCNHLEKIRDHEILVVGYGSTMCCLSTIIDGYHRGYKFVFVHDASLAKATAQQDELSLHVVMTEVMAIYAQVKTSHEVFA